MDSQGDFGNGNDDSMNQLKRGDSNNDMSPISGGTEFEFEERMKKNTTKKRKPDGVRKILIRLRK